MTESIEQLALRVARESWGRDYFKNEYFNHLKFAATFVAELAKSQEPFGYWHAGATEEESDFFLHKDSGDVGCEWCVKLYTHPVLPQPAVEPTHSASIAELEREVAHWKANHANEVKRSRILKERLDMLDEIERVGRLGAV